MGEIAAASNMAIIAHYPFIRSSKYLTTRAQCAGNGHFAR